MSRIRLFVITVLCLSAWVIHTSADDSPADSTAKALERYDMRWIEASADRWPVVSRYIQGDQADGTLVWYDRGNEEVARLEMRHGHPWVGVTYSGAREDADDPSAQPPYRLVHIFADGKIVAYGFFVRDEGQWRLQSSWAYPHGGD